MRVRKSEEKGGDVSLASHLVRDAYTNAFDVAVIVTNDSNLVEPIRIVTQEIGKRVGPLVPVNSPSSRLTAAASFHLHIRPGHLARAQMPSRVKKPDGSMIERPAAWLSAN